MIEKVYRVEIAAPVERVWQEITRSGTRCRPMFGTVQLIDLRPGGQVRHRSVDGRHTFVAGEVVEVAPPRRLVHTFTFPNLPDAPTLVTWDLTPQGAGTLVTVTHSRFDGQTKTYKAIDGGWPTILRLYKQVVETGDVGAGTKLQQGLMGAMSFVLPKSLRTDVVEAKLAAQPPRP